MHYDQKNGMGTVYVLESNGYFCSIKQSYKAAQDLPLQMRKLML